MSAPPATSSFAVTRHDTNPLPQRARALYVGTGGNVTLRHSVGGADAVFYNVPSGTVLPVEVAHVLLTGTTADNIRGLL